MNGALESSAGTQPVDVEAMRKSIVRLIGPDPDSPDCDELARLSERLREQMALIVPEVEQAALKLPTDDLPRHCALACVGEAGRKLRVTPGTCGPHGELAHARKLARTLSALCDHWEALTGVRMCLVCDQPIRNGQESLQYNHVSPSGGAAGAGRIHTRCANTVRRH
ncbi:DUF6415 family natural product biosynthesis protein [Streptomyces sp. NPDC055692]|uniref:DUF6415 family natural product biosynthesis protein n=1 Tax=Streptomyces sp. NPDC055692 TaxID=3155683 RepID=UPI0034233762